MDGNDHVGVILLYLLQSGIRLHDNSSEVLISVCTCKFTCRYRAYN